MMTSSPSAPPGTNDQLSPIRSSRPPVPASIRGDVEVGYAVGSVLRIIQDQIAATRIEFTEEEALALFPKIQTWVKVNGRRPDVRAEDPNEKRLAAALLFLQKLKQQREAAEKRAAETATEA